MANERGYIIFAVLPVHLIDGRWAWLEYVKCRKYIDYFNKSYKRYNEIKNDL